MSNKRYLEPDQLPWQRLRELTSASLGHKGLHFAMRNGDPIEGIYRGCHLGVNGLGRHCFLADIDLPNCDEPYPVDLSEVIEIKSVQ